MSGSPSSGSGLQSKAQYQQPLYTKKKAHLPLGETHVNTRSCCTSYFNFANCSTIFFPSAIFSGSSASLVAWKISSIAWVCRYGQYFSCHSKSLESSNLSVCAQLWLATDPAQRCRRRSSRRSKGRVLRWHISYNLCPPPQFEMWNIGDGLTDCRIVFHRKHVCSWLK